jgi:ubiquinone/menaquinone biosynthesis C-methylase UbiE
MIKDILKDILLEEVSEGIFSCLAEAERKSSYDEKVNAYDMVVGNRFYNRILWKNWPANYRYFCKQSLESTLDGVFLDAGCGSLVFTAGVYAEENNKLIVLLDHSLGMLTKGRERIKKIKGYVPSNIVFMQGDIFNLPFKERVFDSIGSFGVLHLFEDKVGLITELERVKKDCGKVFLSSLVGNNAISTKYLEMLKRVGEVACCHSSDSLKRLISEMHFEYKLNTIGNMAYIKNV